MFQRSSNERARSARNCRQRKTTTRVQAESGSQESPEEFREKCVRMLERYGWKLLDVEQANPVPNEGEFSEEVEDMLARTRTNPNASIWTALSIRIR